MRGISCYGCGLRFFDHRRTDCGAVVTTRWVTLFFLPIIPLSRWKVHYLGKAIPMPKEDPAFVYEPKERIPLEWGAVLRTWLVGWSLGGIAVAPIAGCLVGIPGAASPGQMVFVFASLVWPLVVVFGSFRSQEKFLESTRDEPP